MHAIWNHKAENYVNFDLKKKTRATKTIIPYSLSFFQNSIKKRREIKKWSRISYLFGLKASICMEIEFSSTLKFIFFISTWTFRAKTYPNENASYNQSQFGRQFVAGAIEPFDIFPSLSQFYLMVIERQIDLSKQSGGS